ncbi:MAG TPA: LCP family protein [Solirubrobacteraceae bacterium]|nr:LCP family protein [Solirubrobacteraceae bacterium]
MSGPSEPKIPRPGLGLIKRFVLGAVLIALLSAAATSTAGLLEVKDVGDIIRSGAKIEGIDNVLDSVDGGGPQTILVLGSDKRYSDGKGTPARSDTIMLIRLDPNKEATAVMSLPRDLRVTIPGSGTNKINAAYAFGGAKLSVQTIKALLNIEITHVVEVQFNGFQRAVNKLGGVYVDVDRRYFNDHGGPGGYATIDLKPGYQRLVGSDALDYVRFRHLDSDDVRAARQQGFLRQAKDQFGLGKLFGSRKELLRIFAAYTRTDIRSDTAIVRLLKLAFESSKHPIRTIHLEDSPSGEDLVASPDAIAKARKEFLNAKASSGLPPGARKKAKSTKKTKKKKTSTSKGSQTLPQGVFNDRRAAEDYVASASTRLPFPLYYAPVRFGLAAGSYEKDGARVYDIFDRAHHKYRAYRVAVYTGYIGQYYGIQGMDWKSPPILDNPSGQYRMAGRTYDLYSDGGKLRIVAYRTDRAVYWVSNTLSLSLSNKQMLAIARSLRWVGS